MSNYYKSKCCGEQVDIVPMLGKAGAFQCQKCHKECEVTAMLDTPGGVPKLVEEVINDWNKQAENLHNGVPKEEKVFKNRVMGEFGGYVAWKPDPLTQLKDEMEKAYDEFYMNNLKGCAECGGNLDYNKVEDFIFSHLQKTYEVAEKAGYEKCKADLRRVVEGDDDAVDTLEEIIADLSTSDTK